jgi:hypothetical protein
MNPSETPNNVTAAEEMLNHLLDVPGTRVVAVADTTGVTRRLTTTTFNDLAAGRIGVLARPGMRRPGWLAADLLRALGCRDDVTGAGRPGEGDMTLVAVWLRTHQVRHVYVQHAWTLRLHVLEELTGLLEHTNCTLWLVGDTPVTDAHTDVLAPWTDHVVTGEQFLAAWADLLDAGTEATAALTAALEPAQWPDRLPDDDFTTFRAACRDLLAPAQFGVVDAYFRRQVVVNRNAVAGMVERGELDEERIATWLQDRWESCTSMAQYLTFIRAAQVAFSPATTSRSISTSSSGPHR